MERRKKMAEKIPQYLYWGGRVPMIYLMSVGCGMQFAEKNGSCPGLNGWRGGGSMAVVGGSGEGVAAAGG